MKIMISSFYQIRNMPKNAIPMSTALWDPKWFHGGSDSDSFGLDKRGVINGLRANFVTMPSYFAKKYIGGPVPCQKECPHLSEVPHCAFMDAYRAYLNTLHFDSVMLYFENVAHMMTEQFNLVDPFIVLLVHESPKCSCAERPVLKEWFSNNGIELEEFIG